MTGAARTGARRPFDHRAPIRGERTHQVASADVASAVAQHIVDGVAEATPMNATRPGTPWPAGVAPARTRGSGHPLRALTRPGTSRRRRRGRRG